MNKIVSHDDVFNCDAIEQEFKKKSKIEVILLAKGATRDGDFLLVPLTSCRTVTLRDKAEVKRLRSRSESLKPIAARDGWYFACDA